jgi:hypothetical protein
MPGVVANDNQSYDRAATGTDSIAASNPKQPAKRKRGRPVSIQSSPRLPIPMGDIAKNHEQGDQSQNEVHNLTRLIAGSKGYVFNLRSYIAAAGASVSTSSSYGSAICVR